jgi:hypothetical protein
LVRQNLDSYFNPCIDFAVPCQNKQLALFVVVLSFLVFNRYEKCGAEVFTSIRIGEKQLTIASV